LPTPLDWVKKDILLLINDIISKWLFNFIFY
jgi:hypothetical protein